MLKFSIKKKKKPPSLQHHPIVSTVDIAIALTICYLLVASTIDWQNPVATTPPLILPPNPPPH